MNIRVLLILLSDISFGACRCLSYKERRTRRIVSYADCSERMQALLQSVVDAAHHAKQFFSDAFNTYRELSWWGEHQSAVEQITDLLNQR
jgi:hypothetical protein